MAFLLDYPLGKKRLKTHLQFFAANLSYEYETGRLQVLRLVCQGATHPPMQVARVCFRRYLKSLQSYLSRSLKSTAISFSSPVSSCSSTQVRVTELAFGHPRSLSWLLDGVVTRKLCQQVLEQLMLRVSEQQQTRYCVMITTWLDAEVRVWSSRL